MANSNQDRDEVDRLSELPEPLLLQIISLLPTKFAVRTSLLLDRRFRHLWTASSSLELDRSDFPPGRLFNDVTSRCLRLRDPSSPLLRFCLKANDLNRPFSINLLSNWLNRAYSLGLRDLSLHIHSDTIESLFPLILSFGSLHSLFLNAFDFNGSISYYSFRPLVPATFPLTQLKYLHIKAKMSNSDLKAFIMEQRNLEYLCIEHLRSHELILDLSSQSVKTLKLICRVKDHGRICLSFPKLEFLDLNICLYYFYYYGEMPVFYGEMPVLRKVQIETLSLPEERVPVLCDILKSITNVSELTLHIGEPYPKYLRGYKGKMISDGFDIFHPLVEPGKDMLTFPNLRSFKLSMCFYENALQDLICLLHHSPVIDSLHLIHVERPSDYQRTCWVPEVWHSKLPLNSEGNRNYAHFSNLQTGDKKTEVIKLL
ncbi:F-box/LRR-repeat protein 25-like protein [Carex littledalei]|uniref:F-box/LRR-repeat protein 25-like protein n=1 Tax=Carex littledalei TaxID=544730 RepID=A0A833VR59_9POAL|nr:F-box/LRR-repeat protein 25-like protein [Carex littledalei]